MSMNSVNTNLGAMVALASLNRTGAEMQTTQKAISTGYRVADAKDDGAAFAIAQRVRSDIGGLTAVNQQLGNTKGLLDTTLSSLSKVADTMKDMKTILTSLANGTVVGDDRNNYIKQYTEKLQSMKDFVADATYNDKTLIANLAPDDGGTPPAVLQASKDAVGFGDVTVVRNEKGSNTTVGSTNLYDVLKKLDFANLDDPSSTTTPPAKLGNAAFSAANMQAVLGGKSAGSQVAFDTDSNSDGTLDSYSNSADQTKADAFAADFDGVFTTVQKSVGTVQNTFGTSSKYINDQITYNNDKIDAMTGGLGALVDADLSKEAANLQALQVRQQLGTQALSMANQAPQSLLSLFR